MRANEAGWKTSEFWLTLIGVGAVQGVGVDPDTMISLQAALVAVYTAGRSILKGFNR